VTSALHTLRSPIARRFGPSLAILVAATVFLVVQGSAMAASAPSPYRSVRACLLRHEFKVEQEAHGPTFGWTLNVGVKWRRDGMRGTDNAIIVVGSSVAASRRYEVRLGRVIAAIYKAAGAPVSPAKAVHRRGNVVYAWTYPPETKGDRVALAHCVQEPRA
jgi:hypothetical protein